MSRFHGWAFAGVVTAIVIVLAGWLGSDSGDSDVQLADVPTLDVRRAPDGAIWIRDVTRGGADGVVTVERDAATDGLVVREPGSAMRSDIGRVRSDGSLLVPGGAEADLRVELGGGDDTLVADYRVGGLGGALDYAGGEGFDEIDVRAEGRKRVSHAGYSPHDGLIDVGVARIAYRELEPVTITGSGGGSSLLINVFAGQGQTIQITDGVAPGDGFTTLTATGVEDVNWSNFGSVEINCGPENNAISMIDVDSAALMASLQINGEGGDDSFGIDFNGNIPAWLAGAALSYDGGAQGNTGDSLTIAGGSFTTVTFDAVNANDGSIDLDGGTITYTGLEPIIDATPAATKVFNYSAAAETIILNTGATAGDGFNVIDSTAGERIDFTSPSTALVVNCGGGADTLTVSALEGGPPVPYSVSLDGGTEFDQLIYAGPCAATINPTTIVEPGVMTVGYANFENVQTIPPATATCTVLRTVMWPARRGLVPVGFSTSGSGMCDGTVTVQVFSNEPEPPLAPDAVYSGGVLRLRAERLYPGSGRVYLIVVGQGADCCSVVVPTLPVGAAIVGVRGIASAAEAACRANRGTTPPGFTQILQFTVP